MRALRKAARGKQTATDRLLSGESPDEPEEEQPSWFVRQMGSFLNDPPRDAEPL